MESVCEVIGFEIICNEETGEQNGTRIYAQRPLQDNVMGEGIEAVREYINIKYVDYKPSIGDKVVFIKNSRGFCERVIKF